MKNQRIKCHWVNTYRDEAGEDKYGCRVYTEANYSLARLFALGEMFNEQLGKDLIRRSKTMIYLPREERFFPKAKPI